LIDMGRMLLRYLIRSFFGFLACVLGYSLIAFLLSLWSNSPPDLDCFSTQSIYVSTNGVHLDLIVPAEWIQGTQWAGVKLPNEVNFVSFGWGDQGFYLETPTWNDLRFSVAAKALFWRSKTAMHLTYYHGRGSDWEQVPLCLEQMEALLVYIRQSFEDTPTGLPMLLPGKGYGSRDDFYEGKGSYSILRTCNNWANQGLKKAGVKTAIWSPLDKGVLYQIRKNYPQ